MGRQRTDGRQAARQGAEQPPAQPNEEHSDAQGQDGQEGAGGATADPPRRRSGARGGSDTDARYYRVLRFSSKEEAEDHYNRVFTQRHRKMKDALRKEIEDEIREEVQAEFAEDKEAAEKAVGRRSRKIEGLQQRVEELEEELEESEGKIEEAQLDAKKYERVIEKQWNDLKPRVPEHVLELMGERDVLERISYVNRHADQVLLPAEEDGENGEGGGATGEENGGQGEAGAEGALTPPTPIVGSPATPPGTQQRNRSREEDQEAQQDYLRTTHGAI